MKGQGYLAYNRLMTYLSTQWNLVDEYDHIVGRVRPILVLNGTGGAIWNWAWPEND